MIYLTTIERVVIESLSKGIKNAQEIIEDTGLVSGVVFNTLNALIIKDVLCLKNERYSINETSKERLKEMLENQESIQSEIKELINYSINLSIRQKKGKFVVKKVCLTAREEQQLETMMNNMNRFIDDRHHGTCQTKSEKVIFWGENKYSDIIEYVSQSL
jgi:hypothetical protein